MTKVNRHITKGDCILINGIFHKVTGSSLFDCKMIVSHSGGVSILEVFARSEVKQ